MTTIFAPRLFDGTGFLPASRVTIADGRIVSVVPSDTADADIVLPAGRFLAPGYVDLQVNGGGGVLLNDSIDLPTMAHIADAHAAVGTTSLLPTLISGTRDMIRATMDIGAVAQREVAGVLGLHIEGPFLSPARPGIHPPEHLIAMTDADQALLTDRRIDRLLLTLAPEIVGLDRIAALHRAGVVVFAGHTDATAEQAIAAYESGVVGCTHLFNAMSQLGSRAPGVVGATLSHAHARAGLICDGLHVHPAAMRAAFSAMGPGRLFLVSDSMPTAASDQTEWVWRGETIRLVGTRLARADGTLAGAHVTMADCVRNAVKLCGIAPADALHMATLAPALAIGSDDVGRIAPGARADLIALTDDLMVTAVWRAGTPIGLFAPAAATT